MPAKDPGQINVPPKFYAHTTNGPSETWEPLEIHLENVAHLATEFAAAFGSGAWGELAGSWHDLGKYRPEFRAKLFGEKLQIEHAGAGAALAHQKGGPFHPLAFIIAGHHSGLSNREARGEFSSLTPLAERIKNNLPVLAAIQPHIPPEIFNKPLPSIPSFLQKQPTKLKVEWWSRMLFSSLIDADRLATEAFDRPANRPQDFATIPRLLDRLESRLAQFQINSDLNRLRHSIVNDCRRAADQPKGIFSFTISLAEFANAFFNQKLSQMNHAF